MSVKLQKYDNGIYEQYWFHCPGCKNDHAFTVKAPHGPLWTWNGDMEKPTFSPSLACNRGEPSSCHSNVTDGKIYFHADSWHDLKGQTIDLPDYEEN